MRTRTSKGPGRTRCPEEAAAAAPLPLQGLPSLTPHKDMLA